MKSISSAVLGFLTLVSAFSTAQAQITPRVQTPPRLQIPPRLQTAPGAALPAEALTFNPTLVGRIKPNFRINAQISLRSPTLLKARGAQSAALLGQNVTVQGFYYQGSIPMIVDDIARTQMDMVMPPESYIPLSTRLVNVQNGEQIALTGQLVLPNVAGLTLFDEPSALRIAANVQVQRVAPAAARWQNLRAVNQLKFVLPKELVQVNDGIKTKYAVLIVGGINSANNHERYWNDLKQMYFILRSRGYLAANIRVIYADGKGLDGAIPVNYTASKAHINAVFAELGVKMDAGDELYVMINDHGGGFLTQAIGNDGVGSYGAVLDPTNTVGPPISEAALGMDLNGDGDKNDTIHVHNVVCLWGENMTDDEFGAALDQVKHAKVIMIQMKQCFSGGFTQRLARKNRIVMSSSGVNEVSWAHSSGNYGAFTYAYFTALMGHTPDSYASLDTDPNHNGQISLVEAWNYARTNDSAADAEHGLYADTDSPPIYAAMPGGGQGTLGGNQTP